MKVDIDSSQSIVAVLVGILILVLSVHLLYHLFVENANISRQLKALCFFFVATYIPLTIANLLSFAVDTSQRWIYNLLFNVFYNIINVLLYLIIIWRYHETFKSSQYCASNRLRVFIISLIFVYFAAYSSWIVAYGLYYRSTVDVSFSLFLILFVTESILLIVDIILTVIVTYLFTRNLILLAVKLDFSNSRSFAVKSQTTRQRKRKAIEMMETSTETSSVTAATSLLMSSATSSSSTSSVFPEDEQLNIKQQRLLTVCVRLLVLTVPAMLSTSAVWCVSLFVWYLFYYQHAWAHPIQDFLHIVIVPLDSISNFFCVYLAFDFVARHYRFFCCCVHKCCYAMFKRSILKKARAV